MKNWFLIALLAAPLVAFAADPSPATPADQLEYAKKLHKERKEDEARAWAQKAADQGLAEAWFWLGYTMLGDSTPYYKKAAEGGYPEAFDHLYDNLLFRAAEKADVKEAKRFADLARAKNVNPPYGDAKLYAAIDRCAEAGAADVPAGDVPRQAKGEPAADDPRGNIAIAESYANGWGVKRNAKLAIAFTCHASEVPAELAGMVEALYETKDDETLDEPFRFCDYVTSGMNQGQCAAEEEAENATQRGTELAALAKGWTAPQRAAFERLRKAADSYFEERSSSEIDQSGTARAAMTIEERAKLEGDLLAAIRSFEDRKYPHDYPKDEDFEKADRALNQSYKTVMAPGALGDWGTVKTDGVKKTQRLWITYRDGWVAFVKARYPHVSASAVKTWLTTQRAHLLDELKVE